jgi:O-acetyl-ADP-ribose deacetylase (regulator of RNase III)
MTNDKTHRLCFVKISDKKYTIIYKKKKKNMPTTDHFQIIHGDITTAKVDYIVNPANSKFTECGGVCGAIFRAAGAKKVREQIELIFRANRFDMGLLYGRIGYVIGTDAFNLPSEKIFHIVAPKWRGAKKRDIDHLRYCYSQCLHNAIGATWALPIDAQCEGDPLPEFKDKFSIAFPLIGAGRGNFPREIALRVARESINEFFERDIKAETNKNMYEWLSKSEVFLYLYEKGESE